MQIIKEINTVHPELLAAYIAENYGPMSHLKLQKLLYLIEGYHLAYFETDLIEDEFEAWVHGPVSRKLYNELKDKSILHSDVFFETPDGEEPTVQRLSESVSSSQYELINEVLELYANETGLELESITHNQAPWINARKGYSPAERCEKIISKKEMMDYFQQFIS